MDMVDTEKIKRILDVFCQTIEKNSNFLPLVIGGYNPILRGAGPFQQ